MNQILKNRKGVTLVELLAVVVILGIIAAIAIPTIGGLIERSRKNAAEATFITIVEQARLYSVAESTTSFTLEDLEDGYLTNLDVVVADGDTGDILITVSGSTVTISIGGTATGMSLNGRNMVLSGSNFTGDAE